MSNIAEEYEALLQFLYLAPVGLIQTTIDGAIVMINPISAQLLMPLSRDGSLVNLFSALEGVAPELRHLTNSFSQPYGMVCEGLHIQVNAGVRGKSEPQILSLSLLKLDETRLMSVLSDVSLQVKRERQLKQNEALLNAILTGITDYAIINLDEQGRIEEWNTSIGRLTGFTSAELIGQTFSIFYPVDSTNPDRIQDQLREADHNGWSLDEGWRVRADGQRFWGSVMIAPLQHRQAPGADTLPPGMVPLEPTYCLIMRDITEKREVNESHRKATACDHLTGISNRRSFFESAELELERNKRSPRHLSMIMFDADNFKAVNDTYGHPAGDAVLRDLAAKLTTTFRQLDVVARIGGEEFAVLLPSTDLQSAAAVANRFRQAVESGTLEVDGARIRYTVSGGVSEMNDSLTGLDELMKRADLALYAAKSAGRNRIEISPPD